MPDSASHPANLIIGRGLIAAEAVADELRRRLVRELSGRRMDEHQLLELARDILWEFEPLLAEALSSTDLAAWISGIDRIAGQLPDWVLDFTRLTTPGILPPAPPGARILLGAFGGDEPIIEFPLIEKAAESLMERRVLRRAEFDLLADAEKRHAFTVAGQQGVETIETIRDVLALNVAEGTSLRGFREQLREAIDTSSIGPAHLETIYRTNVQSAFHEGHDRILADPIVSEVFPYQAYLAIRDSRARETHRALEFLGIDGTNIYRRDDPFWDLFTPPFDFNCRCTVNAMTIEAAARKGVGEAQRWLDTGQRPPLESRLPFIPFRPPAGFQRAARLAA
jgi:SPP1 gp7 family putative phage head morphogenesis protein